MDGVANAKVWKAFFSLEPMTLDEARKKARIHEVIYDVVYTSPFDFVAVEFSPNVPET